MIFPESREKNLDGNGICGKFVGILHYYNTRQDASDLLQEHPDLRGIRGRDPSYRNARHLPLRPALPDRIRQGEQRFPGPEIPCLSEQNGRIPRLYDLRRTQCVLAFALFFAVEVVPRHLPGMQDHHAPAAVQGLFLRPQEAGRLGRNGGRHRCGPRPHAAACRPGRAFPPPRGHRGRGHRDVPRPRL